MEDKKHLLIGRSILITTDKVCTYVIEKLRAVCNFRARWEDASLWFRSHSRNFHSNKYNIWPLGISPTDKFFDSRIFPR